MPRVAIIDGFQTMARMLASELRSVGHEVLTELIPVDFERIVHLAPQVIVVSLYRMNKAFDRPIKTPEHDILGFIPLSSLDQYPDLKGIPILLLGSGLQERDIPSGLEYDLFLSIPKDIDLFPQRVTELASSERKRRKVSHFFCPHCGSRLTFASNPDDLFCPRCRTAVAILDDENCLYTLPEVLERSIPCKVAQLLPASERSGG